MACFAIEKLSHEDPSPRIIYIDQFAISNMAKAFLPHRNKASLIFWEKLFEKLNSLVKQGLIICPFSTFHVDESLVYRYFNELERIYNSLSNGVCFINPEYIKRIQLYECAKNWASGNFGREMKWDYNSIIIKKCRADKWKYNESWKKSLRLSRKNLHKKLSFLFSKWQTERYKGFDDWYEVEIVNFAQLLFKAIEAPNEIFDSITFTLVLLAEAIIEAFIEAGVQGSNFSRKLSEFLFFPYFKEIPFIKIAAMLFAALARKAAAGQRRLPNRGMITDIHFISLLLPYCDAMFIDKECHTLLQEMPLKKEISYGTKIFSLNNKDEFLEYLNQIQESS